MDVVLLCQTVTWYHFAPTASVVGTITINDTEYAIIGVGQQDHVFGTFVPEVTLFQVAVRSVRCLDAGVASCACVCV